MPDSNRFKITTRNDVESLLLALGCKPVKVCHSHDIAQGDWEETNEWGIGCIVHYVGDNRRRTGIVDAAYIIDRLDNFNVVSRMSSLGTNGVLAITYRKKHCPVERQVPVFVGVL